MAGRLPNRHDDSTGRRPAAISSGLSIMAVGTYSFTIRLVPELRARGLILLDRMISWDDFFTYSWYTEEVIEIEYKLNDKIRSFKTMIPDDDQQEVERKLSAKITEKLENEEFDEYEELE